MQTLQPIKILIVEDQDDERKLLAESLKHQDHDIYLAANGRQAIEIATKIKPDLVLLDITMPSMDGYTVLKYLKTYPETANTKFIFVSGSISPADRVKGLSMGAIDYIVKPYKPEEVILRIKVHTKNGKPNNPLINTNPDLKPMELDNFQAKLSLALFSAASQLMKSDLASTPNVNKIATELRTNTKRLNQAFKDCSDHTPIEYLRKIRMDKAKELLRDSFYEIAAIAKQVGFKSPANFSTAFRKEFGMTPNQYRNSND